MYKDSYHIIGVMSGTSLDGVDLCYASYKFDEKWEYKIINTLTYNYSNKWKNRLLNSISLNKQDLKSLDLDYTDLLSSYIKKFINEFNIIELDAVSSHGHTVFHQPKNKFTYQIGNLPELTKKLGFKVICDFRVQDVEFGGQGAPLVPIGDKLLFPDYTYCLNLGGFSNISFKDDNEISAFDICPVNVVLNHYSRAIGHDFDLDGSIASNGKIISNLLDELNSLEYYKISKPKSLGLEWVIKEIFNVIDHHNLSVPDILRTYCEHIAIQIQNALDNNISNVLITGGGAKNKYLIQLIKNKIQNPIVIPNTTLIDFKEALIFGFLGLLRSRDENNCLGSVTGAKRDHSSGKIYQ